MDITEHDGQTINLLKTENSLLMKELQSIDKMLIHLNCVLFKFIKRADAQFMYTFTNGISTKPQNLSGSDLVGHTLDEMFEPETALFLKNQYEQAYIGNMVSYEILLIDRYYLTVLSPIQENGKTIEVVGTSIDVTDQKVIEGEMNNHKSKFTAIFNEAQDAIILFDDTGLPVEANPAASDLLGISIDELKEGKYLPYLKEHLERSLEKLKRDGDMRGESVLKRIDGGDRHVDFVAKANIFPNIHLAILRDITDKKELEESLRKSETLQVVGELAAGIGHEIRNPMTAVKGFIQLLKEDPRNLLYYDIILNEFDRIESIISEFMVLSKPQAHHFEDEDISGIIKNTITLMEPHANLMNVSIQIDVEDDLPKIRCERNQLKQVFINLIKNGIECMENGGWLSIYAGKTGDDRLFIKIKDEGCGIPTEMIEKIGEPFYTTKSKGTGLGLMVSYRIIQNHKGSITVESELGKGTTFIIELPINN